MLVVFFNKPVANPASDIPLILPTTVEDCVPVTSPDKLLVKLVAVAALPEIFPETLLPDTLAIFASVTDASAKSTLAMLPSNILAELTASVAKVGEAAVPAKSPANLIFPSVEVDASGEPAVTCAST